MKKLLFLLMAAMLVLTACGDTEEQPKKEPVVESEGTEDDAGANNPEESTDQEQGEEQPEESQSEDVSREYKNALKSAQNYLSFMAFSEKGLFEQLTSEHGDKYPEDAAQYAIDNVEVDYNEQALKAAENYQEIMPMSDQELFDQLTSEYGDKYTEEQAQYALDNLAD